MKLESAFTIRAMLVFLFLFIPVHSVFGQVSSSFDSGDEGWMVHDADCYDGFNIVYETHPVTWHTDGGNPGGYISHLDVTNYCSFFSAPAAFVGDKSDYVGGILVFALNSTVSNWPYGDVVVLIGAGMVICHELPEYPAPPPVWTSFAVQLIAPAFTYDDENGAEVSTADFQTVMADLQVLLIPAEFGSDTVEIVSIDSVIMAIDGTPVPESAARPIRLKNAHPNPFNPQTTITFSLAHNDRAEICVYDLTGRLVNVLTSRTYTAGDHTVVWGGMDAVGRAVPSGSYIVRMETETGVQSRKVMLLR